MTARSWARALALAWLLGACDGDADAPDGSVPCTGAAECDDGMFCNGAELCEAGRCAAGPNPCGGACDESTDACNCTVNDADGDRHDAIGCGGDDCDDNDRNRHPGLSEVCDAVNADEDCDPRTFGVRDGDGDSYPDDRCCNGTNCGSDCDDASGAVHPNEAESCDRLDNDCDESVDESLLPVHSYPDCDRDGHGSASGEVTDCVIPTAPPACGGGWAVLGDDCDDANGAIHPGLPEICDNIDSDCSGDDEDADNDGRAAIGTCIAGPLFGDDCDDTNPAINPYSDELCDALDDDCSSGGGAEPLEDADGDMHAPLYAACLGGLPRDDCDDADATIHPGALELCDHLDSDCSDGEGLNTGEDGDGDGHAAIGAPCAGGPLATDDCDDANALVYPGASLAAPRAFAPENGALSGSLHGFGRGTLRPTFRWGPASCDPATYELAIDDSCTTPGFAGCTLPSPEVSLTAIADTSARPAADLPVSMSGPVGRRYYWRVRGCAGAVCGPWSAVHYVDVGRAPSDFNGDGRSDVAVGAPFQSSGASQEGNAFVYFGEVDGIPASPFVRLDSPSNQNNFYFGDSVASAGDINADGYADLVIGAPGGRMGATSEGLAYVYLGGAAGLTRIATLENPTNQPSTEFGTSVASAGDINADGYADLVVGAPKVQAGAIQEGNAYIYYGGPSGVAATPNATLDNPEYLAYNGLFGHSVASAGDVNGDGIGDLIVGAYGQHANIGAAFLYYGNVSGVSALPSATLRNPEVQSGRFGWSVASAGDVNGDGYGDLVVGASFQSAGASDEGNAFVFLGGLFGAASSPSTTLDNPTNEAGANFGYSVAAAGDVNADGYSDVLVGARLQDGGASDEGNAFVYYGSTAGIPAAPSLTVDHPTNQIGARFGWSVASAGDVNGDGCADVIVGAPYHDAPASDEGNAFVYHGSVGGLLLVPSTTLDNPDNNLVGFFGDSVARLDRRPLLPTRDVWHAGVGIVALRASLLGRATPAM